MNGVKCLVGPVAVLTGAVLIAACGGSGDKPAASSGAATSAAGSSSSTSAPASQAAASYDIAKVGTVKGDFPPGYDPMDLPRDTLTQDKLDAPGVGGLSTAPPATVTPPECAVLLKPLAPAGVGAQTEGIFGNKGPNAIVVMVAQAADRAGELGHPGCDHVVVDSPTAGKATVDQVPGPDIAGAKTMGVQAHITSAGKTSEESTFTAVLGDRTVAVVQTDADPQAARDLLVKVAAALKG